MTDPDAGPGDYAHLEFNAPLSGTRARELAGRLAAAAPRTVLDIGCGWGELLLRVLQAAPEATGVGVDSDSTVLERGRRNAEARNLADRVTFSQAEGRTAAGDPADLVLCVGSDHALGTQREALVALCGLVAPGGRLLFGSGFWERTPTTDQAASIGYEPDDLRSLADLVEMSQAAGYRPLFVETASRSEWDYFESGFLADWEEWLVTHPDHPDANRVRERSDEHRTEWLRGWRDVAGFAYLTLGIPR